VASLPRLPHFEQADHLPITRRRLEQRLTILEPEDLAQLRAAEALTSWQRHPIAFTTEDMVALYRRVVEQTKHPGLREFIELRMDQRTAIVALRRKALGLSAPGAGELWGVGRWVRRIETNWDDADLTLGTVYPWMAEAREHVGSGNALALERLMMNVVWRRLARSADERPFGFEQVFAFVFQWDILNRWLSHDAEVATERFQNLLSEVTSEHEQFAR